MTLDLGPMPPVLTQYEAISANRAKESMSLAYLRAIAAQAGFNTRCYEHDEGVDVEIGSSKALERNKNGKRLPGFFLSFQAKSTSDRRFIDTALSYDLKVKNYNDLRDPDASQQFLFVYLLPTSPNHWIRYGESTGCRLSHIGYFLDLKGAPPVDRDPKSTIAVRIPMCNRLTAHTLIALYKAEAQEARQ